MRWAGDAHDYTQRCPPAVQLQIKLSFEDVVAPPDKPPNRFETLLTGIGSRLRIPSGLVTVLNN